MLTYLGVFRAQPVSGTSISLGVEGMREPRDRFPLTVTPYPKPPLGDRSSPHPASPTHQAVPSEVQKVEAVHAEADVLPVGGQGHNRLGVVPGHVIVDVP